MTQHAMRTNLSHAHAGFSMLELCKAVLTVGDPEAKALASVELAALTLEDISAKIARLAEEQGARTGDVPKAVRNAQRALKQECDRLAACLPSALSRWAALASPPARHLAAVVQGSGSERRTS